MNDTFSLPPYQQEYGILNRIDTTMGMWMVRLLLGFIGLLLMSCSAEQNDMVRFKPKKGDEHHYRVYSQTMIDLGSAYGSQTVEISNDMLLGYKVANVGDVVSFDISIDAFKFNTNGSRLTNLNAEREPALQAIMSQGFAVDVRLKDNKITRLTANNEKVWQAMLQDKGEQTQQWLYKMMQTPGVPIHFPAKVGHSFKLAGYLGVADIILTVTEVTAEQVLLSIEATEAEIRLLGYIRLNRHNGWIDRMALLSEMPFDNGHVTGTDRSVVVMIPQSQHSGNLNNLGYYNDEPYEYIWPEDFPADWLERANRKPNGQAIFPQETGIFSSDSYDDEALRLTYPHQMLPLLAEGRLELTDLRFLDRERKPLPINTAPYFSYLASWFGDEYQSVTSLSLTGWELSTQQFATLDTVEAEAAYHYARLQPVTLSVAAKEHSELEYQDIRARLEPVSDKPNTFLLTLTSAKDRWFSFYMGLPAETMVQMVPEHHSDNLLMSAKEAALLSLGKHTSPVSYFRLTFKQLPPDITLYINELTGEISAKGKLWFVSEDAYAKEDNAMPLRDQLLYQEDQDSLFSMDNSPSETVSLKDMPLPQPDNHALALTLSAEQAALCELNILQAPDVNGHKLHWQQVADSYYDSEITPKKQRWQLTSEDGIRQYFYDMKVTSRLQCEGDPKWTALQHNQNGSFWRLDMTKLDPELDLSMPLQHFIAQYRFLNRNNKALALVYPSPQYEIIDEHASLTLKSILIDGRWLKISGRAVAVEKLDIQGQAVSREWTAEFPPLP